jgi:hypothetical protein
MLVTVGYFIKDFFVGVFAGSEGLGPTFEMLGETIKFAFIEISNVLFQLMDAFGLMQEGGADGVKSWGFAVGFILKWLVKIIVWAMIAINTFAIPIIKAFASNFFFVASAIQMVISTFFRLIQLLGKIPGIDKLFGLSKGTISEAAKMVAEETQAKAGKNLVKGAKMTFLGQAYDAAKNFISPGKTVVTINGKEVAEAVTEYEISQRQAANGAVP